MLRFIGWLAATALILLLALTGAAWYLLRDPNQLKPQLTALIHDQTGVPVQINGDLAWQLFPPLILSVTGISADHEGSHYELGKLSLDLDLRSVIANQDLEQWQVKKLEVTDLTIETEADAGVDVTRIEFLHLSNFAFEQISPFATQLTYLAADADTDADADTAADADPIPLSAHGNLVYRPATDQLELLDTRFETTLASGVCNLDTVIGDTPDVLESAEVEPEDAIIPVSVWRGFDWHGECVLDRLEFAGEQFENARFSLENVAGNSRTNAEIPHFFGGSAVLRIDIDAQREPVAWRIEPDLHNVDSQALMTWLDQRLTWAAPLAYGGAVTMTGNTPVELVDSIQGRTRFDGGQGRIDVSKIKMPLLKLATLFQEGERIRKWPKIWTYERMNGVWTINGKDHEINLALDNLTAAINGNYDPFTDAVDMRVNIVFEDNPGMHSFDVSPLIVGLPIPLRCKGTLENPRCRVNAKAAQRIVASVLMDEQGSELRAKLEEKIEEDVPEEYRDAARSLLEALGRSLQNPKKTKKPGT